MVRTAEGPGRHKAPPLGQLACDGINFGGLHGFLSGERRQDAGQALCQHGFAGAGRADEQHVVPAGGRDHHGPPRQRLAHNIRKIRHLGPGVFGVKGDDGCRGDGRDAAQSVHHFPGRAGRVDRHAVAAGFGGLGSVFSGHIQRTDAAFGRRQRHGQHAGHRPQGAVQRQLAQKGGVGGDFLDLAAGRQQGQQQRQVVDRAGLAHIRRGQIDRDAPVRELEAQVFDGGAHAVCTFPHGGIRQTYNGKCGQPAGDVRFHSHGKAAQAPQAETSGDRIHDAFPHSSR